MTKFQLKGLFQFIMQVEELTRKTHLQDVELEKTSKQLKEAIAIAGEETAKCKAAKEVIKSLTAQVRTIHILIQYLLYLSIMRQSSLRNTTSFFYQSCCIRI